MTRFTHRLGFNLTNPLARDIKLLADFFERIVCTHLNTEAHPQYFRFARGKRLEQFLHSILRPACNAASAGATVWVSSMKSPRCESSSSPIGVSIEIGSFAIFRILRILSSGISMRAA